METEIKTILKSMGIAYMHDQGTADHPNDTRVFLVAGMTRKPTFISETRTAHCINGRWYWSDGTAVDGSAMRWEARSESK